MRWKPRRIAKDKARTERKINPSSGRLCWFAICNICKQQFPESKMELDHIISIAGLTGFTTFDDFIDKLYCEAEQFQVVCTPCHDIKSAAEGVIRRKKKNNKKSKK